MADSYLNKSGLSYFWTKIKNALSLKTDKSDFDLVDRYYRSLVPVGTAITSNKNLNTLEFLKVGKYYCSNNATTATLTNCPTGGKAFMMEVFSPLSTTIDNETTGAWVYRLRVITSHEGKTWYQLCNSNQNAGSWSYGGWQYMPNSGDVNNQIYANVNSKYGRVQLTSYTADSGQWVKIASMSHHTRSNDNANYTFRLDLTGAGGTQYRQSYTFGVGARMSNTSLGSVRFDYLGSERFNYSGAPELEDLVKVTRKYVAGNSSTDHYIYFEIWVKLSGGWRTYWLHPTNKNYKGDYSISQAFFRNSDEWTYSSITGTSAAIGEETYLTEGFEEVPMIDAREGSSYLNNYYSTRPTTADTTPTGKGGLFTFKATSSMSGKPSAGDGHIIQMDWDNTGGYDSQLYISNGTGRLFTRGQNAGTWQDWKEFATVESLPTKISDLSNTSGGFVTYCTCTTAAGTAAKVVTIDSGDTNWVLRKGSIIAVKFTNTNTASNVTLNVNNTGAKSVYYNTSVNTGSSNSIFGYANRVVFYLYDGTNWVWISDSRHDGNDNTYTTAYCSTAAGTAAKTASMSGYVLTANRYTVLTITNANTAASALTLNINGKGAKPLYINGTASSSTNHTLPAGSYIVWYDGTNYYIYNNGEIPRMIHSEEPVSVTTPSASVSGSQITDGSITYAKTATGEFLKLQLSTVDIGEGVSLPPNTLYGVYE